MEKISLKVQPRGTVGKKVKNLRREGILPANIFGKDIKSQTIQVPESEFRQVYKSAGETGVVEVKIKDTTYPVLIQNIQKDPITGRPLHVDFHKVNLKEKITAHVPIRLVGEAPAEKSGIGLILQTLNELEIECLPGDIPHEVEVDVNNLSEVGQTVHVADLDVEADKVEVKNDPEEVVVSVQTAEMKEEEVTEASAPEEVEAIAEKGKEEAPEGKEAKEGEKSAAGVPTEPRKEEGQKE